MVDPLKAFIIHLLVGFLRVTFLFRYFQLHRCHGRLHKGLGDTSEMLEDGTGSGTKADPRMYIGLHMVAPCFPLSPAFLPPGFPDNMQLRKLTRELNKLKLEDSSALANGRHFRGISPLCAGGSHPLGTCAAKA